MVVLKYRYGHMLLQLAEVCFFYMRVLIKKESESLAVNREVSSRKELDVYIRSTFGEKSTDLTVEASEDTLRKLSLSTKTIIYGAKVKEVSEI